MGRIAAFDGPRHGLSPGDIALLSAALCLVVSGAALADAATAVEYYNPSLNHYFLTSFPEEIAALDAGNPIQGWVRTGGEFSVFTAPADGLSPVCRFVGTPGLGISSHFYTADAGECAKVKTMPAWTFEAIAFYIPIPINGDCGTNWPVYRSYYTDGIADANHRFTVDLTAAVRMTQRRGDVLEGVVMCAPVTDQEREADVVRFLEQATLGPTESLIAEVKAKGIAAWIDEQIPMNVTRYTQPGWYDPPPGFMTCVDDNTPPITPEKFCASINLNSGPVVWEFFRQSKTAPDQLRLRMAHVWHQIFVVSQEGRTYGTAEFQQRMRDGAFGTFENLLASYTLSPQLGKFQNWVRNIPEHDGIRPNENFARELMQLMTIGVNQLNEDGTKKLDAAGQLVPTYGQADIMTLARVLTGFTFPTRPGQVADFWDNPDYFIGDMIPFDQWHDQNYKSLLNGRLLLDTVPGSGGGAMAEVRAALKMLVDHPNTPPFISRQLIQKTVTSSPTPGYVARVAAVFKDNGAGVRGDLAAVTRAILLDPEARGARKIDPEYGRLREPVLFWTAMILGLDVATDGFHPEVMVGVSLQGLFSPQTVFNYYPADFTLSGTTIPAPEFGIFTTTEFINRANQVNELLYSGWSPIGFVPNAIGTPSPGLLAFQPDAANADALVEHMNRLFLHGAMKRDMRTTIVNALNRLPSALVLLRAKLAVNLTLVSIDYQVQK